VPGCPPSPEGLMHGVLRLQEMVQKGETHSQRRMKAAEGGGPLQALQKL